MKNLLLSIPLIILISCTSDQEKYEKELKSCMAETQEKLNTNFASMDEAIAGLDFNIAHTFYACYKEGLFKNNIQQSSGCISCIHPKREAAERLSKAEVSFLIGLKEFDKALAVHDELIGNAKGKISVGYLDKDGIIGSDQKFQIFKSAVLHYLEVDDIQTANKWAKRAPIDVNTKGVFLSSYSYDYDEKGLSQQEELLELIKNY